MRVILLFVCVFFIFTGTSFANQDYTPIDGKFNAPLNQADIKKFFSYQDGDMVIGDPKTAKVTVVGYTAYSCPHCGHFISDIMPKLKKEYFENKAKNVIYVYKIFPMSIADVKAKQLVLCKKNMTNKDRIKMNEMLYSTSSNWAHNAKFEQKLTEIARIFGLQDKEIFSCLGSKEMENKILQERMDFMIRVKPVGVPVMAVNGNIVDGYGYKQIADLIDKENKK